METKERTYSLDFNRLNESPRQRFIQQVCAACKDYKKNGGGCGAHGGDIVECIQIMTILRGYISRS